MLIWYNKFMNIPITQSDAWQKLQDDLGEITYREKQDNYQYLAIQNNTPIANYLYLPYGPIVKDEKSLNDSINSLKKLAAQHDITFIRIEPQNPALTKHFTKEFKKAKDLNPKETWVLDLEGNEAELKQKLPSRLVRYYKNMSKNGLTIEQSQDPEDIHYLIGLQKALAKEKGISTFSESYLKTELAQPFATLYLLKSNQEVVAAGMVFDDKTTRYNLQGAQSDAGRKLHATGILTIQLILDAKANGQKFFDFWGIAPEGAPKNHPWAGFTNFKKTFAGREVDYAGTYDIVLNPFKYRLYQAFRSINRLVRKIK